MNEVVDVNEFVRQSPPFDELNGELLEYAQQQVQSLYLCQDNQNDLFRPDEPLLYLVRSGAFDLLDKDNNLIERLESGDMFGFPRLLTGRQVTNKLQVIEDGIVYIWPAKAFERLRRKSDRFERYFLNAHGERLLTERSSAERNSQDGYDWTETRVEAVIEREPVQIASDTTINDAAKVMAEHRVSCVLITDEGQLKGILTDRDLRMRVLAAEVYPKLAVAAVMTPMPATVYARHSLFDALTIMSQANIHHLPVLDHDEKPVGVLTNTDLMRQQRSEPVVLINALYKAKTKEQLVEEAAGIPDYLRVFSRRVKDTATVGRLLASLTDTMTRKLIQLYEQEHGKAPAAYAWVAFGSQAREDQTLGSDQDNGLILADDITPGQEDWFEGMATYVCHGLADCGIRLCPGDVMAMNPEWRMTRVKWKDKFQKWIYSPTPKAIMHSMIFFDSRVIAGSPRLYKQHRDEVAKIASKGIFIATMARHIGDLPVPLGLFNRFRTRSTRVSEQSKEVDVIDLKKQGIAIINDIVRIYAVAEEITEPATPNRLTALRKSRMLTQEDNQNLAEAWQFLTALRLQVQLSRNENEVPANSVQPHTLSTLQRRQLKAAFRVIKRSQQGVALKFGRSL